MGIPVEIVGEGIDWPAWVQAIGSIVAIIASAVLAILIDQGAARRSAKASADAADLARELAEAEAARELAAHQQKVLDWQGSMKDGVDTLNNLFNLARRVPAAQIDAEMIGRIARNMAGTIQMYLMQGPPNPHLGWALFAIHGEFGPAIAAAEAFRADEPNSASNLHDALHRASSRANGMKAEYEAGPH